VSSSVDVVIVTCNRYELTESCLRHLAGQTIDHCAIVVDNGSTDDTPARLRADWPDVRLVALDRNHGFAVGSNRGVAAGSGEVVVLLNNDVTCRADFLERLLAPFRDASVGSVASLMLQPGEETIDSVGLTADVTLAGFPRLHGLPVARARDPRPVLAGPAGTAAAYRREAWELLGGLDEAIFTHMEDFDLALRLRTAGWEPAAAPDAVGVHVS
jgi:N-acetylglucosaminyl-diphospho-decaprenol L-rhamnosyltransferase